MRNRLDQQTHVEFVARFEELYRDYYDEAIKEFAMAYPNDERSFYIDAADVYQKSPDLLDDWQARPAALQACAEDALAQYDLPVDVDLSGATVRLTDPDNRLGARSVTALSPTDIGDYVALHGQLARITKKKPRLRTATYVCQRCGRPTEIEQSRTEVNEPHNCPECEKQGPFRIDHDQSDYINQRKIKLEEPIEDRSQARGQSLPVYVEGDLCDYGPGDSTLPDHAGESATILGTVHVDESELTGRNSGPETDYWIDAQAIVLDTDDESDIDIDAHREEFEALAGREDALETVAESLAPSLHAGEDDDLWTVKQACAAWLFNAYRVDPAGSGSKRGDLHMCVIGDPGTGKSTLMSYLHDVLPSSEFRTGTGLSEVGLTAAAVQEEFAGQTEWTLQPGILPRADGGHCMIDEIDGVVDENTKAIHDALEGEQVVKTDKAGIKADLPTRTALLAGGNPTYTRFDKYEDITAQIDLDPALFDRMDLVFALQDEVDEASDRTKAGHALDAWDELAQAEAAERTGTDAAESDTVDPAVPKEVLRAWVAHARRTVYPTLTDPVKERLRDFYVEVRNLNDGYDEDVEAAVPATPRTLEAGIRLSIAIARLHLSETVEPAHAEAAIDLTEEVVGLRLDPDSGEFDTARVSSGTPKSQKDRIQTLKELIGDLADEHDAGAPVDVVLDEAEELGITPSKAEHEIDQLKQQGELYEPKTGVLRPS